MTCNFQGMLRAPISWEVTLSRKPTENDVQNARKRIAYVTAPNELDAKRAAKKAHPQFHPTSARKV